MNILIQTIDGIQEILGICPCCGEIFRLVEGKFVFPKRPIKSCEYSETIALEKKVAIEDDRLSRAEERFEEMLERQRDWLAKKGQRKAKRKLKKIDPVFSARDINPQDVKVIFDPVEYVVFNGLNSQRGLSHVEFISRQPESNLQDMTTSSIERAIKNGNISFETLRLRDDGSFEVRRID